MSFLIWLMVKFLKFIRENECDVVLRCQRVYLFFYLDNFVLLISVKISSIQKTPL